MSLEFILSPQTTVAFSSIVSNNKKFEFVVGGSRRRSSSSSKKKNRIRFKVLGRSLGDNWKLNDIDTNAVQERLNSWLLKTQSFLSGVTAPLVKQAKERSLDGESSMETKEMEEMFLSEQTIDTDTSNGSLSLAVIISVEQFSRLNGLTGRKMQKIFEALLPEHASNDARYLVEYCCFRFLSRYSSEIHPCLKEPAFQRLIFITMLAWQHPYSDTLKSDEALSENSLMKKLVCEKAFVRIAPAVAGVADRSTAHNLFKTLAGDEKGISLKLWIAYVEELLKVHKGRKSYQIRENLLPSTETVLCIASSNKRPVLKWKNNMAWPGKLTLTDKALYFEEIGLMSQKEPIRLDLTRQGSCVEKARVGPLGSAFFDSAVSVSSDSQSEAWLLEFIDFGGEMRRDVWHAFISEVIYLHKFLREYGPEDDDQSVRYVYGAQKGKRRATMSTINNITRLQALQFIRKLSVDPLKLVQFSYLWNAPFGHVVCQALAVNFWGGPLVTKMTETDLQLSQGVNPSDDMSGHSMHVFDIDGSVYLRNWMRSPSWASSSSISFWKNSSRQGVVLSKNLVVLSSTLVERAAEMCKEKSQLVEKTQATIDAAMIKGIPSNIDLFKELMLPLICTAKKFDELRRWKKPHLTVSFLAFAYTVLIRNMLPYVFPAMLMFTAASMLFLKSLKEQGRLGRTFGIVTIRDQPSSNTIQKIIALKQAMLDMETYLQDMNIKLLKVRAILLAGQPQITTEVAVVLLFSASILLTVPFKYVLAFLLLDVFTGELKFRREMVIKFIDILKERWNTVPAAPVVVLPFESDETGSQNPSNDKGKLVKTQANGKPR
ncbi:putative chromosome-partitioning protein [Thalictrum thalictroides]|uniref:Putative chromosome-partitioning protein n=1 Tax=Thalictrum thalictroides TaxID=46969 RepID=A0A7J6XAI3_THATH|nr:putative chromosome-partitioning protein [Thalictrum thalictroides]